MQEKLEKESCQSHVIIRKIRVQIGKKNIGIQKHAGKVRKRKFISTILLFWFFDTYSIFLPYFLACDARGTFNEAEGNCTCKKYVTGKNCNDCIPGTWNLMQANEMGCQSKYISFFLAQKQTISSPFVP